VCVQCAVASLSLQRPLDPAKVILARVAPFRRALSRHPHHYAFATQVGLGLAVVNLSAALVMAFAIIRVWRWRGHNGAICLGAGLILLNAWLAFQDLLAH
jgi:hypothetical protein